MIFTAAAVYYVKRANVPQSIRSHHFQRKKLHL